MKESILHYLNAGFPSLWIKNWDDDLMINMLKEVCEEGKKNAGKMNLKIWSCTYGFIDAFDEKNENKSNDPFAALKHIESKGNDYTIYVMKNFHFYLSDPTIIQKVKDLMKLAKSNERHLIFLSPNVTLPPELEKEIVLIDTELPTKEELNLVLDDLVESIENETPFSNRDALVEAALGLSISEAENAFAFAYVKHKGFSDEAIQTVMDMKVKLINQNGLLEFTPASFNLDDIGGLDYLKHWLKKRKNSFSQKAKDYGLPNPKGVLLVGVPGSGKSLTAKAVSASWDLPLLRFDFGKVFSSLVGETEKKMRDVLKTAEALSPCVLWLDEIEKGFSGTNGANDSGVTSRVFGYFLSWMQEKKKPVFVFATANNISALPPELLRKGRFDEFFFVDLPSETEREEIFSIHLSRINRNVANFNLEFLSRKSEGFSGAEIETAIQDGLFTSFSEDRELTTHDIIQALQETQPLSVVMKEQIDLLREWANTRARHANALVETPNTYEKKNIVSLNK